MDLNIKDQKSNFKNCKITNWYLFHNKMLDKYYICRFKYNSRKFY